MATYNQSQMTLPSGDVVKFIDNTSGYTKNKGTITKVTAGTGLSGGGTSGAVTLNHSNSVTAQTTQAVYPIKIDAQGHISAYGSAVTIPSAVTESTVSGWGFTKNTGTITGVTGSNGLTGSGTSGSVTISHAAPSTSPAKTTSAVYPITIDKYGHILTAGSAVTIPAAVAVKGNAETSYRTGNVNLTPANIGAATSDHTHDTSIATSTGTNQLSLSANTKYAITAGGTSFIFTTPVDNNTTYSSKTAASGGTDVSLVTTGEKYTWNNKSNLAIGTTASTAAAGNHTHTTSLATSTGTSTITLAHGGKYQLTAGDTNVIFTMPDSGNTDHRRAYYGTCSTDAETAAKVVVLSNSTGWELVPGTIVGVKFDHTNTATHVTLDVNDSGAKSIFYNTSVYTSSSSTAVGYEDRVIYYMYDGTHWCWISDGRHDGNSDTKVRQTLRADDVDRPLLMAYSANTVTTGNVDNVAYRNNSIYANPSTGLLTTTGISTTTINGVTVGSSPKFTDTTYSSLTAVSGGTDVSLVTTGEKYTWNNKTSNIGTVTSVRVQATSPITSSQSTAQTGTLNTTIAHANSGVTAGTYGSATSVPVFTVNATGHITDVTDTTITAIADTKYTTCTLPVFTKAGSKAVTVSGVTANSNPVLDVYIDTVANIDNYTEAWSHIYRADTSANTITFYSDGATSTALTVMIKDY